MFTLFVLIKLLDHLRKRRRRSDRFINLEITMSRSITHREKSVRIASLSRSIACL